MSLGDQLPVGGGEEGEGIPGARVHTGSGFPAGEDSPDTRRPLVCPALGCVPALLVLIGVVYPSPALFERLRRIVRWARVCSAPEPLMELRRLPRCEEHVQDIARLAWAVRWKK